MPRTTHDVDILVILTVKEIEKAFSIFSDKFYVSEQGIRDALRSGTMFNVVDPGKGLKADFWIYSGELFDQSMMARRKRVEIFPGKEAYLGSAEDVLLHKLVWNKITPSERQRADAAGIVAVQGGNLDLAYMCTWAARQSTSEVLEEFLQGKHLKST